MKLVIKLLRHLVSGWVGGQQSIWIHLGSVFYLRWGSGYQLLRWLECFADGEAVGLQRVIDLGAGTGVAGTLVFQTVS